MYSLNVTYTLICVCERDKNKVVINLEGSRENCDIEGVWGRKENGEIYIIIFWFKKMKTGLCTKVPLKYQCFLLIESSTLLVHSSVQLGIQFTEAGWRVLMLHTINSDLARLLSTVSLPNHLMMTSGVLMFDFYSLNLQKHILFDLIQLSLAKSLFCLMLKLYQNCYGLLYLVIFHRKLSVTKA